jgi:hypothetical protein
MKFNRSWILAGIILLVAVVLRLYAFGDIPRGLNRDEMSLGYTAWSIGTTGHDEYGISWPVSIKSFGDQKLPGYVYTLVPFVLGGGLNEFTVRLPSLLAGLSLVWLIGLLINELRRDPQAKSVENWSSSRHFAMLAIAVSPWAIHFSRVAYEVNLALAFFVLGLWLTLKAFYSSAKKQSWLLPLAALAFNTTLLTYHSFQVFLPLLFIATLVIYWPQVRKLNRHGLLVAAGITVITLFILLQGGVMQANGVKQNGLMALSADNLAGVFVTERAAIPGEGHLLEKLLANKATAMVSLLATNLLQTWSPQWLFWQGSEHPIHNPGHMTNLPLWLLPLVLLGLSWLWQQRKQQFAQLLAAWLLIASLIPALTITPQHTTRSVIFFFGLTLVASFGWLELKQVLKKNHRTQLLLITGGGAVIAWSTFVFFQLYLNAYTRLDKMARQDSYHHMAELLQRYQAESYQVITQSPRSSPYIWYLFASRYDASSLVSNIEHYPVDAEGFDHVKRIDNIFFEQLEWDDVRQRAKSGMITLVLKPEEVPNEIKNDDQFVWRESTQDEQGNVTYEVWQITNQ